MLVCCGQGRKTAAQVQRLEALHAKQQAVLRRKTEEAEAARKRLHVSKPVQLAQHVVLWLITSLPIMSQAHTVFAHHQQDLQNLDWRPQG